MLALLVTVQNLLFCANKLKYVPYSYLTPRTLHLKLKSLIHLELILKHGERQVSNFILPLVTIHFGQHHLLKMFFYPMCVVGPLSRIRWLSECNLITGSSIPFYWSVFMPALCSFYSCSYVARLDIWDGEISSSIFNSSGLFQLSWILCVTV